MSVCVCIQLSNIQNTYTHAYIILLNGDTILPEFMYETQQAHNSVTSQRKLHKLFSNAKVTDKV